MQIEQGVDRGDEEAHHQPQPERYLRGKGEDGVLDGRHVALVDRDASGGRGLADQTVPGCRSDGG